MTTALQLVPTREEQIGVYDLKHFGMYFGRTILRRAQMPDKIHEAWMPGEQYVKVSAHMSKAFFDLCVKMLKHDVDLQKKKKGRGNATYEVRTELLRHNTTGEIRCFVFPQVVKPAYLKVDTDDPERPGIDLITGERLPTDWQHTWHEYGGWHSHNTMGTTPSKTDDDTEEKTPGCYAIFGAFKAQKNMWKFEINASMVVPVYGGHENKRRTKLAWQDGNGDMQMRDLDWADIMEWDNDCKTTYHPDVLDNIMIETPKDWEQEKSFEPIATGKGWGGGHDIPQWMKNQQAWADSKMTPAQKWNAMLDKSVADALEEHFQFAHGRRDTRFHHLTYRVKSIVRDVDDLAYTKDADGLFEDVLAPLLEEYTDYRIVPEARLLDLERIEMESINEEAKGDA